MYLNNIILINPMDYIRYTISTFEDNKTIDINDTLYIKLAQNIEKLKESYDCFRHDFVPVHFYMNTQWSKNEHNRKFQPKHKPKHILKCSLNNNDTLSFVMSSLNKLTMANYEKIFSRFTLKIDNNLMKDIVDLILQTNNNASMFNELYVGLIFHIFHLSSIDIKNIIVSQCNSYVDELFDKSLYITNDNNETYDMFCSRIKNKSEIINRIRAFFFLTQKTDFANNTYSFSELVFYIFEMLQEIIHKEDYIVQSEQLLDALLTCFTLNENTCIPTVNEQVVTKNLISCQNLKTFKDICKSLIQLDNYRSYKIKFKIQDLENNIKHY